MRRKIRRKINMYKNTGKTTYEIQSVKGGVISTHRTQRAAISRANKMRGTQNIVSSVRRVLKKKYR